MAILQVGHSLGFAIPLKAAEALGLQVDDEILVVTELVTYDAHENPIHMNLRGKIIKSDGKQGGFVIPVPFARALGLRKGSILTAEISKE